MYRSDKVALVVCGLGVAAMFVAVASNCSEREEDAPVASVIPSSHYANNTFVDGAGWFHASSGRFYPYHYNYYLPASGYYHDGGWTKTPGVPAPTGTLSLAAAEEANSRISVARSSSSAGSSSKSSFS